VYAARYKVYESNGSAGILSREASKGDNLEGAVDPVTREQIIKDITNRNGLIGDKRLWTVSPIPLKFTKTLATIAELEPFKETREDALAIAGLYGIDKDLLPLAEGTTYENKEGAMKRLYNDVIKGVAEDQARLYTRAHALDKIGLRLRPNYDGIACLAVDRAAMLAGDEKLISNLTALINVDLLDNETAKPLLEKLLNRYNNE
jgi:hypothetical protein